MASLIPTCNYESDMRTLPSKLLDQATTCTAHNAEWVAGALKFMRKIAFASVISAALLLSACNSEVKYDPKVLGFSSDAEMQSAFVKGYHTKAKLDEMTKLAATPAAPVAVPAQAAPTDAATQAAPAVAVADNSPFTPSFDCAKAGSGQERMVCADRDLAKLDVTMHQAYVQAHNNVADKAQVLSAQRDWIKNSFRACSDKPCLVAAYQNRIAQLGR